MNNAADGINNAAGYVSQAAGITSRISSAFPTDSPCSAQNAGAQFSQVGQQINDLLTGYGQTTTEKLTRLKPVISTLHSEYELNKYAEAHSEATASEKIICSFC